MKKLILTMALGLAGASVWAQGTVDFRSVSSAVSNSLTMNRALGGTVFRVALYYLPDGGTYTTNTPPTTASFTTEGIALGASTGLQGSSTVASGTYQGGVRSTPATTPGGGFAWFQVRAWETAFGTSYEAAVVAPPQGGRQALVGTSNIFRSGTGDPNDPKSIAVNIAAPTGFFMLYPVPEPSAIGLGLLGVGALVLLRRRK